MRESTMEFLKAKEKAARDRAWQERLDRDPRSDAYQYNVRMADMENQRKIALQEAQNKGLLNVADRNQLGATNRERMSQEGQTGRIGLEQAGLTGRLGQTLESTKDSDRRKALQERLQFYSTPQYDKSGTMLLKAPLDPETAKKMAYGDVDMMYGNMDTTKQRPDNITSFVDENGIRNWTNQPREYKPKLSGSLPGNYPQTSLEQKPLSQVSLKQTVPNLNENQSKPTFESIYGKKPLTLKNIWGIDEERKKQREDKRKSQWTVPY